MSAVPSIVPVASAAAKLSLADTTVRVAIPEPRPTGGLALARGVYDAPPTIKGPLRSAERRRQPCLADEAHIMLTASGMPTYRREVQGQADGLEGIEWLLPTGDGSFAMGTVRGVSTRRYHGLLVGSLQPPVRRIMALSALAESVTVDAGLPTEQRYDLASFCFRPGQLHPRGDEYLESFEKDVSARWTYRTGPLLIEKQVLPIRGKPGVLVRYRVLVAPRAGGAGKGATGPAISRGGSTPASSAQVVIRPLAAMRDFHSLSLREMMDNRLGAHADARSITVTSPEAQLRLVCSAGSVQPERAWWYNFQYQQELERGYDYLEDLLNPGSFTLEVAVPAGAKAGDVLATMIIGAVLLPVGASNSGSDVAGAEVTGQDGLSGDLDAQFEQLHAAAVTRRQDQVRSATAAVVPELATVAATLAAAADDFIAVRVPAPGQAPATAGADGRAAAAEVTILAGFPWFADWGRDAMIALPGLLLSTGRYADAKAILLTFAHHRGAEGSGYFGLVPNVFDDYTGEPHYNTVDASLWFVHAACRYLQVTGDSATFNRDLLPACLDVVAAYQQGTAFGIRADAADGLIIAGDESTQLTWMDAKRDGVVFTPRHGKAVEINALWYNALRSLEAASGEQRAGQRMQMARLAERVQKSFVAAFWDASIGTQGGLVDVLTAGEGGQWHADRRIRPNQIFAASLPHSALDGAQRAAVTNLVRSTLLTPGGVATLDPADAGFKPRYIGRMFERDSAYHNGTAWPWLIGPLAEAVTRAGGMTDSAKADGLSVLRGLLDELDRDCVGQLPEVFDGAHSAAEPQQAAGCPAQAWSVAEALRVLLMVGGRTASK